MGAQTTSVGPFRPPLYGASDDFWAVRPPLYGASDDFPGFAALNQFVQITVTHLLDGCIQLPVHLPVVDTPFTGIEYTEGSRQVLIIPLIGSVVKSWKQVRLGRILLIVNPEILVAVATLRQLNPLRSESIQTNTPLLLGAEQQWFTLLQIVGLTRSRFLIGEQFKCAVVEDDAVLVDLQHGGAFVVVAPLEHLLEVLGVPVHRPCHKRGGRTQSH